MEFQQWREFYRAFPFDDLHRYQRPAALIGSRGGGSYQTLLDFLQPPSYSGYTSGDLDLFRAAGINPPGKKT